MKNNLSGSQALNSKHIQDKGFQANKLNDKEVMVRDTKYDDARQAQEPNSIHAAMKEIDVELRSFQDGYRKAMSNQGKNEHDCYLDRNSCCKK